MHIAYVVLMMGNICTQWTRKKRGIYFWV